MPNKLTFSGTLLFGYFFALALTMCLQIFFYFGSPIFNQPRKPSEVFLYQDIFFQDYGKILASILVAALLCLLLFVVSYFLSFSTQKEYEKSSEYECGFDPFDNATRQPFEVHFYIVGILFLIFDVEVALLFPWAVGLDLVGSTGFWSAVIFLIIITLGFVYEWKRGALSWPHPALDLNANESIVNDSNGYNNGVLGQATNSKGVLANNLLSSSDLKKYADEVDTQVAKRYQEIAKSLKEAQQTFLNLEQEMPKNKENVKK